MSVRQWSTTAADNDDADSDINWAEGQLPGTVNGSARAMMRAIKKWSDDFSGAVISGGSTNNYTLTTGQTITTLENGLLLCFRADKTSSGAATIVVDSTASKSILRSDGTATQASDIVSGGLYLVGYSTTAGAFLGLNIIGGTQPLDATLTALAGVTVAADKLIYATGADAFATTDLTSTARTVLDDTSTSAMRTTLGVAIGSDVQAYDADLGTIAGLTATTNNFIQSSSSAWASRTPTQATATLDAMVGDSGSGGTKGLVPAPASGDAAASKFLKADGVWTAIAGATLPVGMVVAYGGAAAPSLWLLCYGQAISRTTYSALFTAISTTYGVGDGATTFNIPDIRGRVVAGQDDMGGSSANRLTGVTDSVNGDTLGGTGGVETHTLTVAEMPAHSHTTSSTTTSNDYIQAAADGDNTAGAATGTTGGGDAHVNVQPTLILNYIIYAGV